MSDLFYFESRNIYKFKKNIKGRIASLAIISAGFQGNRQESCEVVSAHEYSTTYRNPNYICKERCSFRDQAS